MPEGKSMQDKPGDSTQSTDLPLQDGETARAQQNRAVLQDLRVVVRSIQEHSRWVEEQCGVSSAQLWALWELFTMPGLKVSELSRTLTVHPSTTSNMLDKLEDKGLVCRRRAGPDQRVVRLYLTEAGVALLANAPRPAQGALNDALQRLSDESLMRLADGLNSLVAAIRIKDPSAALRPLPED
jgi:DNA-binding MarR family transcriptional regulator